MFKLYLDDILQDGEDVLNINSAFETSIIREDGFSSSEQILREKTDMNLSLCGSSYKYLMDKISTNTCEDTTVLLEDSDCGLRKDWIIKANSVESTPHNKTLKTSVKDNSFSAYIRDFIDNEVNLFSTNTKNCEPLSTVDKDFTMFTDANNQTTTSIITAFDALDVIKYIVSFFTDNKINVVSQYLTDNRYAITTGYNMHNHGISIDDIYPKVSLTDIFNELRKKLRIYMSVEKDSIGNYYLLIEDEDYFFKNDVLLTIDKIPNRIVQTKDLERSFARIEIGSKDTQLQPEHAPDYPQETVIAWNKETFNFCGTCSAEKQNPLDLVSDYIIDSNMIYEALNAGVDDFDNDSKIFMFNYQLVSGVPTSTTTLYEGKYAYNLSINNENTLDRWIDYAGKCVILNRTPKYGCLAKTVDYSNSLTNQCTKLTILDIPAATGTNAFTNKMNYSIEQYDNQNALLLNQTIGGDVLTLFTVQENGSYNFKANVTNLRQKGYFDGTNYYPNDGILFESDVTYTLRIKTFTNNTLTTLIDTFEVSALAVNAVNDAKTLNVETGMINLAVGNAVIAELYGKMPVTNNMAGLVIYFYGDSQYFKLIDDGFGCENVDYNDQNARPYVIEFDYPLCYSDYVSLTNNKAGIISVAGNNYWIKEVIYRHKKQSTLKLIGNNLLI